MDEEQVVGDKLRGTIACRSTSRRQSHLRNTYNIDQRVEVLHQRRRPILYQRYPHFASRPFCSLANAPPGVVYAPNTQDNNNLVNGTQCAIDAPIIQKLGANVIRVFSVDPTLNHDSCMKAFSNAGIYVILDLATPSFQIDPNNPQWNTTLRDEFAKVIDNFQGYDNLFGFFSGNEVVSNASTSPAAAYVKASIADMKAYRDTMQYRAIPIGYTATDISSPVDLRTVQQDYFDCGNASIAADFYGVNRFTWCGDSSFTASGYSELYDQAAGYDIPTFLSETGCTSSTSTSQPNRTFDDQVALLGRQMNDRFSGAIVYEWHQEKSNFGLVSYSNSAATGTPRLFPDYSSLSGQWATLTPQGVKESAYQPSGIKRSCPQSSSGTWSVKANEALPTVGLSGVSTPTAAISTGSGAATTISGQHTKESNGISRGAIAGIVLGVLVLIALILGAILFLLRRKRQKQVVDGAPKSEPGRESDKMVAAAGDVNHIGNTHYDPQYHELSGVGQTQELDPVKGHVARMIAPELAQPDYDHELPHADDDSPAAGHVVSANPVQEAAREERPQGHSPYVEAQRRMEIDWLESEEARLRQRREVLAQQQSASNT